VGQVVNPHGALGRRNRLPHTTCKLLMCCCGAGGSACVYVISTSANLRGSDLSLLRNPGLPRDVSIQPFIQRNVIHFEGLAQSLIQSSSRARIR